MKIKVLMVCLGNICRSPLAEGVLQHKVNPEKIMVASAGTAGYHIGNPPDVRSIAVAKKYGVDISLQRCRQFSKQDFDIFDHIYVMDNNNYTTIITLTDSKVDQKKVQLLLHDTAEGIKEVPDPYYAGENDFDKVYHMIDNACTKIASLLNQS